LFVEEELKMVRKLQIMAIATTALFGVNAFAEVTAEEAKQLGGSVLTIFGAEKAGNKEGTIPPYTGEVVKTPAGYDKKNNPGTYVDPWNEKPLFSISAQNADKYADKLTAGQREMFKKYPTYRMDIYPTHRTMTFPKYVLDNTIKNATSCKAINGGLILSGCYGGVPFPIPKTGAEVMWNHLMEYEGVAAKSDFQSWTVTPGGSAVLQNSTETIQDYPYYDPAKTGVNGPKDIYWQVRVDSNGPPRKAGEKIVLIDAVDALNIGRRAYQYIPGQRRVKLAPDISYDTPSPFGGGGITMDDSKTFLGALDRYEWKLIGKQEKYIRYNAYKVTDFNTCPANVMLTKNFDNPDCIRWELHRVWVIEGQLKASYRHIYNKRVFYFDEDGYLGAATENYDAAGKMYRVTHANMYPFYEGSGATGSATVTCDLQTGGWVIQGLASVKGLGNYSVPRPSPVIFSPEALAGGGIR
jgi:Protein of unknown function (DUF1329)